MTVWRQGSISHWKRSLQFLTLQSHIIKVSIIKPDARVSGELSWLCRRSNTNVTLFSFCYASALQGETVIVITARNRCDVHKKKALFKYVLQLYLFLKKFLKMYVLCWKHFFQCTVSVTALCKTFTLKIEKMANSKSDFHLDFCIIYHIFCCFFIIKIKTEYKQLYK